MRFTFDLLKTKGRPQQRSAYALVKSVETPDNETIRFDFPGLGDRELPLILALMPVLSHKATTTPLISNPQVSIFPSVQAPTGSRLWIRAKSSF